MSETSLDGATGCETGRALTQQWGEMTTEGCVMLRQRTTSQIPHAHPHSLKRPDTIETLELSTQVKS